MIIGSARSGTTWLARLLDHHPRLIYRHEPDAVLRASNLPVHCDLQQLEHCQRIARQYLERLSWLRVPKVLGPRPPVRKPYRSWTAHLARTCMATALRIAEELPGGWRARRVGIPDLIDPTAPLPLPLIKSVDSVFHLGLFAVIFFAAPHVLFFEEQLLGFGWTPMPHWAFIVASQFAFFGLLVLWLRRLLNPVSKLISTLDDHIAAILTFVVMLTGCLALLQGFTALRLLHRFSVELFLIYFPFSALMHTFTFIPSRAFTGAWFGRRGIDA